MKLKSIYKLALNRVGEREGDRQIENIVMAGINAANKIIAMKHKMSKSANIVTVANVPLPLPTDFVTLIMLLQVEVGGGKLSKNEFFIDSNLLLVTNPDSLGALTMLYNFIPADLTLGTDDDVEPEIQSPYHSALSAYAAYYYYNHKGNGNAAGMCLSEFNAITGLAEQIDNEKTMANSVV